MVVNRIVGLKNLSAVVVLLAILMSCSDNSESNPGLNVKQSATNTQSIPPTYSSATKRKEYWAVDTLVESSDTILNLAHQYRISVVNRCLNDSAVVNIENNDIGPIQQISHNYQSVIEVTRDGSPWVRQVVTKEIFNQSKEARKLGSLREVSISRTAFQRYESGKFVFYTRLGVPDSDIFVEAELTVAPNQEVRIMKVWQEQSETE